MPYLTVKPSKKATLLLSALFALSASLLSSETAQSNDMNFGNMDMPSPGGWSPPAPPGWSNMNQQQGNGPPPRMDGQGNGPPPRMDGQGNNPQQQYQQMGRGQQGQQGRNNQNRRTQQSGPSAQQLENLKSSLHLAPGQESAWSKYSKSLTSKQNQQRPNVVNQGSEKKSQTERMELKIERMQQRLNQEKAKLSAHKGFLAVLDDKQKIIFDLLSKQFQQQRRGSGINRQQQGGRNNFAPPPRNGTGRQ